MLWAIFTALAVLDLAPAAERLVLNEDSLWTGDENPSGDYNSMGAYQVLGELLIELPSHQGATGSQRHRDHGHQRPGRVHRTDQLGDPGDQQEGARRQERAHQFHGAPVPAGAGTRSTLRPASSWLTRGTSTDRRAWLPSTA